MKLCDYGCGQEAKYPFKNGKWCCSKLSCQCPAIREKNKIKNKGKKLPNRAKPKKYIGTHLCDYGCGKVAKYHFSESDKYCCSIHYRKCDGIKKQLSENFENHALYKSNKGQVPWNKGKTDIFSLESIEKIRQAQLGRISSRKYSIKDYQEKHPLFSKIEEMRYNPDKPGEIQFHCKNHKCPNSKEKGGWFTPSGIQIEERKAAIEKDYGNGAAYFYCSELCKQECSLFGKSVNQLIKEDQIIAGIIEDDWYNSSEYQIWREQVFKLDNRICQYCGNEGNIAHHILPQKTHPELSLDPENGITVCEECHYKYAHSDQLCTTGHLSRLVCQRIIKIKTKL